MHSSDELLSAYLDGELTADEQARAESLLASDEQVRAAFEELRACARSCRSCLARRCPMTLPRGFCEPPKSGC